jgi:hypothetical protein
MPVRKLAVDTEFSKLLRDWSQDLATLRQHWLLSESSFLSFGRDRGISVRGVVSGEPSEFHKRGWLSADGRRGGDLLFHPFRLYVLEQAVAADRYPAQARAQEWNTAADLAIILEPIYWPKITDYVRSNVGQKDRKAKATKYKRKVLKVIRGLDVARWRNIHESLRISAAWLDKNAQLYVLMRLSKWEQRERLQGRISGALWVRHMAEVIRMAFEETHRTEWPEEDQAFGYWYPGARIRLFGSERPFDDPLRSKPFLAYQFGLFSGSVLRWYVEGETEYYAALHILHEPPRLGIELVNLKGEIASEKRNAARKLEDALKEDLGLRRFSVISFDRDVTANEKAIRRQVDQDHIVGAINANAPDFEFANFSLNELVEIAALMDERLGFDGEKVRKADWKGVATGRTFADRYRRNSERRCSPKGKEWGEALAAHAIKHNAIPTKGAERPLLRAARAAAQGWRSNYSFQKEHSSFDRETFEARPR